MIHKDFECEIYYLRHGESQSNATPGYIAGADLNSPLTERGVRQAELLGIRLKAEGVRFDRVYSSSMIRTVETTENMLTAMGDGDRTFSMVDALIEQQMPGWSGVLAADVMTPEMVAYMRGKGSHFVPPEGESFRMVQRRVAGWLEDEIIYNEELVSTPQSLKIAVIGHGAAGRCLFHYIMGFDEVHIGRLGIENCSISRFVFNREGWKPVCLNDSFHIRGAD
jgi:broad specificity phosphatase PhoE